MRVKRIIRESVITKVAEELRRLISANGLVAGDTLPSETELSLNFGISRNSLREALRVLVGLGYIDKEPNKRAVVRAKPVTGADRPSAVAFAEIAPLAYELRGLIERRCAELTAKRANKALVAKLGDALARFEQAFKTRELGAAAEAHTAFHDTLVQGSGNPILINLFNGVRFAMIELDIPARSIDESTPSLHRAIFSAINARNPIKASAAVQRHFRAFKPLVEFISKNSITNSLSQYHSNSRGRSSGRSRATRRSVLGDLSVLSVKVGER